MQAWQEELFDSLLKDSSKRNVIRICKKLVKDPPLGISVLSVTGGVDEFLWQLAKVILKKNKLADNSRDAVAILKHTARKIKALHKNGMFLLSTSLHLIEDYLKARKERL